MSDYIYIENEGGSPLVIDESGEIIESAGIDDALKFVVLQREEAHRQAKEWGKRVDDLDRVILRKQEGRKVAYGPVVAVVRGGTYNKTDCGKLAEGVATAFPEAFDMEHEGQVAAVLGIIASATGFKRDAMPEDARILYDFATEKLEKRSWIETSTARELAPERRTSQESTE